MTEEKKHEEINPDLPLVQFVRFQIDIMGPDGVEVHYPYGWVNASKVLSFETVPERMGYLLGFTDIYDDYVVFNRDTELSREDIDSGKFEVIGEATIYDFTNGKEYFSDASFEKIIEWCKEYERKVGVGSAE